MIVVIILLFVFVIAAFTLVSALTMLYIEKKDNLKTLSAIGANQDDLFRVILLEGLLISFRGIVFGMLLGYAICSIQYFGSPLVMPNSNNEPFPIAMKLWDGVLIFGMVSTISFLASYLPAKFIFRKRKA